jgi:hypothetical protein
MVRANSVLIVGVVQGDAAALLSSMLGGKSGELTLVREQNDYASSGATYVNGFDTFRGTGTFENR